MTHHIETINGPIGNLQIPVIFQVTLPSGAVMTRPFDVETPPVTASPKIIVTESGEVITLLSA